MLRRSCLPLFASLLLVGCASDAPESPTEADADSDADTDADSDADTDSDTDIPDPTVAEPDRMVRVLGPAGGHLVQHPHRHPAELR